jgi:hypothetical protein
VVLFFRSTFLDTLLACTYKKGEGIFRTDSVRKSLRHCAPAV